MEGNHSQLGRHPHNALNYLYGMAAFVVIVAGLRSAQSLVVPFLMAAFLAVLCGPPLQWLREKRVPTVPALLLVISGAATLFLLFAVIAGASIDDFVRNIGSPGGYLEKIEERKWEMLGWLETHDIQIPDNFIDGRFDPQHFMRFLAGMLARLGSVLSNALLVLLTLIFILLEVSGFPKKLLVLSGGDPRGLERANQVSKSIRHYISIKTWFSLVTGILIGLWLRYLNVEYPLLWGMLAFLFNFIPNIGSVLAAIPAIILATIHPGPTTALYAAIGYLVVNGILGNVIEPRIMGRGLGLSTLVVFVSLVFWGWLLGPVGMFLSAPLTMIARIYLDASDKTRWLAVLLSENPDSEMK